MKQEKEELLSFLLNSEEKEGDGVGVDEGENRALMRKADSIPQVKAAMLEFQKFLPAEVDEELTDFLKFALLGVSAGFAERTLSPFVEAHLKIIPPLLDDIRSVYAQIKSLGAILDSEEFRFRAFDYGVHKALYLDWDLYLSKDMY